MTEVLTSAQMRAIEQAAIASGAVTGRELMERAGAGVVAAVLAEWPDLAEGAHRAVVLCGPGNNGGDGFVVARLLKERGWAVEVFLYGDAERLPPDARVNYERWCGMGTVDRLPFPEVTDEAADRVANAAYGISGTALVVDALFGTGLGRSLSGLHPILSLNDLYATFDDLMPARHVAVDIPSGISADTGEVVAATADIGLPWGAFRAGLTVAFHRLKVGHVLGDGPGFCGKVVVADIGLSEKVPSATRLVDPPSGLAKRAGHKFSHGHALILSGPPGHGGAARLAARAALRIGAGLVTVACPPEALAENAARLDAIMLRPVADATALAEILRDDRITALCIGPGLGLGDREGALVAAVLAVRRPTVLDADALTLIARNPALFAALHRECVLTPHGGEFARLFPAITEQLAAPAATGPAYSKLDATRDAAAEAGCIVLFKGPDTVIASPSGAAAIHAAVRDRAAPWLATAGSGDVLAGLIAGLMARGFWPQEAAETAAFLHVEAARAFGPGLIAEDLPEMLPKVMRDLGVN